MTVGMTWLGNNYDTLKRAVVGFDETLIHDVLVSKAEHLAGLAIDNWDINRIAGYVWRCCKNALIDQQRRENIVGQFATEEYEEYIVDPNVDNDYDISPDSILHSYIVSLDKDDQAMVLMYMQLDCNIHRMSKEMGVPDTTLRTRLKRVLNYLRDAMEREWN